MALDAIQFVDKDIDDCDGFMVEELRQWLTEQYYEGEYETTERELIFTPVFADHMTLSNWVICVDGSPPKGTLFVPDGPGGYFYYLDHRGEPKVASNCGSRDEDFYGLGRSIFNMINNMVDAHGKEATFVVVKAPVPAETD